MKSKKFVCIHGHFYQPPRENPWLEDIEPQISAAPYHDWNERINAECYAPNTAARIKNDISQITEIINNYEFISFNFGPTLLDWLERFDPRTVQELKDADRKSAERLGHGNAMAQVYNHIIMPLASRQDKVTQVKWGIANFEKFFARKPEGMWLAETAVDMETLDVLAQEGIKYTVLAPGQAAAVRANIYAPWQDVRGARIDPRRAYFVSLPSGGKFPVFFYDGPLSQAVAFEGVLNDGVMFANRILGILDPYPGESQLVNMATDGESYGHHHHFGEMALAYALKTLHQNPEVTVTNYAAYLAENPPAWEVQIVENSSWSCMHGVERWRSDCGCGGRGLGWSLAWRGPLREAYNNLRDEVYQLLENNELFKDPWEARNDYIHFLQSPPGMDAIEKFLKKHQTRELTLQESQQAMLLMACARFTMYIFTSCGWFFDDISGLEPVQNMRYAARAVELAEAIMPGNRLEKLLATLERAVSNNATEGTGRDIWRRYVNESRLTPELLAAEAVLPAILNQKPLPERFHCYFTEQTELRQQKNLNIVLNAGSILLRHFHLPLPGKHSFGLLHNADTAPVCVVGPVLESEEMEALWRRLEAKLQNLEIQPLAAELCSLPRWQHISMNEMSGEGRYELAQVAFDSVLDNYRKSILSVYDEAREAMRIFREMDLPLPRVFLNLAETVIADQVISSLRAMQPGQAVPKSVNQLAMQAKAMGIQVDNYPLLQRAMETLLDRETEELYRRCTEKNLPQAELLNNLLDLAKAFNINLNLWRVQNTYYRLLRSVSPESIPEELKPLAVRLGFAPEILKRKGLAYAR